jgi:type II secretory pathway pseudopilin PulG
VRGRKGFALAAGLLAIMIISALLASLFFAVTEETRTNAATGRRDHALAAAESVVEIGIDQLATRAPDHPSIGTTDSQLVEVEGFPAAVHTTRLDSSLFWVVGVIGDARDPAGVTRRIGLLVAASGDPSGSITIVRIPQRAWSELF